MVNEGRTDSKTERQAGLGDGGGEGACRGNQGPILRAFSHVKGLGFDHGTQWGTLRVRDWLQTKECWHGGKDWPLADSPGTQGQALTPNREHWKNVGILPGILLECILTTASWMRSDLIKWSMRSFIITLWCGQKASCQYWVPLKWEPFSLGHWIFDLCNYAPVCTYIS